MKTIHIIRTSLTAAWLAFCTTATAQQLVGGKVSLLNKEVKKQGNNVKVGMDLKLDNLQLKSNQGIVLIPMIVNRDDTLQMPAMEIMGASDTSITSATRRLPLSLHSSWKRERMASHKTYIIHIVPLTASG